MSSVVHVLAANNFGDTRTGGLAGPMGLFLILLLAAATVLLIRNMNSRLRRLPDRFDDHHPDGGGDDPELKILEPEPNVLDLTNQGTRPGLPS